MSKFLRIPTGDYTIETQDNGTIMLDVGEFGEVVVTGNIRILGDSTTVESTNLDILDNILTLNKGETGAGITLDESGLRIDRGSLPDAFIVFDENTVWTDPVSETSITGAFSLKTETGQVLGIKTNSIATEGGDLYLINDGLGKVSVTGTTNYEEQVFVYDAGVNTGVVKDDDIIPNIKAVVDYVDTFQDTNVEDKINEGDTKVEVLDFSETSQPSNIDFVIDNNRVMNISSSKITLGNGVTKFETEEVGDTIWFEATQDGTIKISPVLEITTVETEPVAPDNGTRIYVDMPAEGGSGIYFVDNNNNRDELISRNRAIVYSMVL